MDLASLASTDLRSGVTVPLGDRPRNTGTLHFATACGRLLLRDGMFLLLASSCCGRLRLSSIIDNIYLVADHDASVSVLVVIWGNQGSIV